MHNSRQMCGKQIAINHPHTGISIVIISQLFPLFVNRVKRIELCEPNKDHKKYVHNEPHIDRETLTLTMHVYSRMHCLQLIIESTI